MHVDLAADYSTEKFLMVLRRFVSIRGYPSKLYSDNGPQLFAANGELKNMVLGWSQEELKEFGVMERFKWDFAQADAGGSRRRISRKRLCYSRASSE